MTAFPIIDVLPECKHLGRHIGDRVKSRETGDDPIIKLPIHRCRLHGEIMLERCGWCPEYEEKDGSTRRDVEQPQVEAELPKALKRPPSQEVLTNRFGDQVALANVYANASLFLVLSGPSLHECELDDLRRRGVVTMGVNNSACEVPCTMMTYSDTASKFHHNIYRDPSCMKFVPRQRLNKFTRVKNVDGSFSKSAKVREFPNTIAFRRNCYFDPVNWLSEPSVNWGNNLDASKRNGWPQELNIMFIALKLAFYLGFRTVYLLGCDWNMKESKPYAFNQSKHAGGCASNNNKYKIVESMLTALKPHFDANGFNVYNCNAASGLTLFEHVSFNNAITASALPERLDASGWYEEPRLTKGSNDGERAKNERDRQKDQ